MSLTGDIILPTAEEIFPYLIDYSCLFDGSSEYLSRTPPGSGNLKTWTYRGVIKKTPPQLTVLIGVYIDSTNFEYLTLQADGTMSYLLRKAGTDQADITYNDVFADGSGYYDLCFSRDASNTTATLEVNGIEVTDRVVNDPVANVDGYINSSNLNTMLARNTGAADRFFAGYVSDTYFIDGQALPASTWGEQSSSFPGLWVPKDAGSLTYGTNGFHLDFANAVDLGNDVSGNNNDWTVIGTPTQANRSATNNGCTLDANDNLTTGTLSNGNLTTTGSAKVTHKPSSGEWYYEKDGVGVSYDADVSGQFDPTLTAGAYNFGATAWADTGPTGNEKAINSENMPTDDYITSGSYTGNGAGNFVYTGCTLTQLVISGGGTYDNDGTDAAIVEFYSNGFKMVSTTDNVNTTVYNWSGTLKYPYKYSNAQSN